MPHGRLMVLVAGGLMIISLPVGSRASSATHALPTIQLGSIATPIHTIPRCAPAPRCRREMVAVCMHRADPKWTGRICCGLWKCSPGPF